MLTGEMSASPDGAGERRFLAKAPDSVLRGAARPHQRAGTTRGRR
jgi:hypothetical protein